MPLFAPFLSPVQLLQMPGCVGGGRGVLGRSPGGGRCLLVRAQPQGGCSGAGQPAALTSLRAAAGLGGARGHRGGALGLGLSRGQRRGSHAGRQVVIVLPLLLAEALVLQVRRVTPVLFWSLHLGAVPLRGLLVVAVGIVVVPLGLTILGLAGAGRVEGEGVTIGQLVAHELSAGVGAVAHLAGGHVEGVARHVLVAFVQAADAAALRAPVGRHHGVNAVRGQLRAQHELAADLAASLGARALGAAEVHEVGLSLGHLAVDEAHVDAVVVLVALAGAAVLQARGAALAGLQHVLDAVLQGLALGSRAVPLGPAAARAQQRQEQGVPGALLPAPGPGHPLRARTVSPGCSPGRMAASLRICGGFLSYLFS